MSIKCAWVFVFTVACVRAEQPAQSQLPGPEGVPPQAVSISSIQTTCKVGEAGDDPIKVKAALDCVSRAKQAFETGRAIDKGLTGLPNAIQIRQTCKVGVAGVDPKKLSEALACVIKAKSAAEQTQRDKQLLKQQVESLQLEIAPPPAQAQAEQALSADEPQPPPPPPPPVQVEGQVSTQVAAPQLSQGQQLTGSAWGTPDACATGTSGALAGKGIIYVHRALVWPKQASDDFGYRLGRRFVVYQVSVTNASTNFQYEISDILVNLKPIFSNMSIQMLSTDSTAQSQDPVYEASSQDLLMLRGVPEKGQDYDPRNMTLHILQGIGSVAAGISGLTPFSDVMGPAMANFNGPFIQALTGIAADHTSTQLNRLSDMAFTSNTIIGKLQTKKFAIFIPEAFVMPKEDQKTYWKDPRTELNKLPFDQLNVCVDGILLVQAATTPDPTFSTDESNVAPNTQIGLADTEAGATIYYTTNGDTPTTNSSKYSTAISVGQGSAVTIKAFALAPTESPSNTLVRAFTPAPPAQKPTVTCGVDHKSATITPATPNDTVYYTEDGKAPTRNSKTITAAATITFTSASETINALEVGNSSSLSPVTTQTCPGP